MYNCMYDVIFLCSDHLDCLVQGRVDAKVQGTAVTKYTCEQINPIGRYCPHSQAGVPWCIKGKNLRRYWNISSGLPKLPVGTRERCQQIHYSITDFCFSQSYILLVFKIIVTGIY